MPWDQDMQCYHGEREPGVAIRPDPVRDLRAMTDYRAHRPHRLDAYAVLPRPAPTPCAIGGLPVRGMAGGIAHDAQAPSTLPHQPLKGLGRDRGRGTNPRYHPAPLVQHQTQGTADHPAVIREALAADRPRAPAFPDGMDHLDPIGVEAPEHRRGSQEGRRPRLRGPEEAQEPGPLGEPREQRLRVFPQPARACPVAHSFARMALPHGDHLTGPEASLRMFGQVAHLLVVSL